MVAATVRKVPRAKAGFNKFVENNFIDNLHGSIKRLEEAIRLYNEEK